jgi:protoporphyrinogen oxidase
MTRALIIGAGPAGLAAAHELTKHGAGVTVLEKLDQVGGLARTINHNGCRFDIGPHRFFTKNDEVRQFYSDVLAEDVMTVRRLTRILYKNRLFNYPLTPVNVISGLGIGECVHVLVDYAVAQVRQGISRRQASTFDDWVTQRFGTRLYEAFFKTYTEKVWGMPCTSISADWAGQRIKSLSLPQAIRNALLNSNGRTTVKSLINEFLFPRLGSGQLYEKLAAQIQLRGGSLWKGWQVTKVFHEDDQVRAVALMDANGEVDYLDTDFLLSSAPLTELVRMMDPLPPADVMAACRALRFREHLGVHLKVEGSTFPDNWIYIHSRDVRMARVANYRNFSREMSGTNQEISPLTAEYFTFNHEPLWKSSDESLIALAVSELKKMELIQSEKQILGGFVVRSEKAYPMMELGYERHIGVIKSWLDGFRNLLPIGRSGMFKYNNQDHAIATGLLAARTAMGLANFDPWLVNIDAEYHEDARGSKSERGV